MRTPVAAVGSSVFLVAAPGIVAGVVPWLLTGWHSADWWLPIQVLGGLLVTAGAVVPARGPGLVAEAAPMAVGRSSRRTGSRARSALTVSR